MSSLMRRWGAIAGIGLALVLCAPAVAATSHDETSAHKFLVATARTLRTTIARRPEASADINAVISQVESGCPHSLPASLASGTSAQQTTSFHFSVATEGEVIVAELHPLRSAYASFSRAVGHLQWSNPDLAHRIAVAVRQARAVAALRALDLCHQVSLAAASNFTRTPPGIRTFLRRLNAATATQSSTTEELEKLVSPLADPADGGLVKQVHQLQKRVNRIISGLLLRGLPTLTRALSG